MAVFVSSRSHQARPWRQRIAQAAQRLRAAAWRTDGLTRRIRAQQIDLMFKNVGPGVVGAGLASLATEVVLLRLGAIGVAKAIGWQTYLLACVLAHLVLLYRYKTSTFDETRWQPWAIGFTLVSFAEGLGWGWASVWLDDSGRTDVRVLVLSVACVVSVAAVPAFASYLPAFFALFVPATLPFMLTALVERDELLHYLGFAMPVYAVTIPMLAIQNSRKFKELVTLRLKSGELAENLRSQIELVEQAMVAKANFLLAASHDLRQPVHAISLFAGALQELTLPDAARRLTGQIENSVVALDGLFAALLDISRLDAHSIEVRRSSFAIQPLIARIVLDFSAEASAKGVALRSVESSARVCTDPILLERVLRNLISNAVRYTPSGRVLVGCRRRGEAVEIQICDTGLGIAPEHREAIFKEYFQLHNPERDRQKGLGLGLAIVQRLVQLLDAPLGLRSQVGRGSVFSLTAPLARAPQAQPARETGEAAFGRENGLIVVVDDEAPILLGMTTLLESWGYVVVGGGSGGDVVANLSQSPVCPNLVISDHWLRAGETGFDVIEQLRAEFNEEIPAILISGDTSQELRAEAQAAAVVLLHKPTPNGKLRAAISQSLDAGRLDARVSHSP